MEGRGRGAPAPASAAGRKLNIEAFEAFEDEDGFDVTSWIERQGLALDVLRALREPEAVGFGSVVG